MDYAAYLILLSNQVFQDKISHDPECLSHDPSTISCVKSHDPPGIGIVWSFVFPFVLDNAREDTRKRESDPSICDGCWPP